jgi:hypothetical protein
MIDSGGFIRGIDRQGDPNRRVRRFFRQNRYLAEVDG